MKFRFDKNLERVAAEMVAPVDPQTVAVELCRRFIDAGMIEDDADHWGESVLLATGPQYIADVCKVLAGFLYGNESRSIPADVFDAFCALIVMGDGDCPLCGGNLIYDETEGHELHDGDYFTPNSWVVDLYVYHCANCGETIKTSNEL